MQPPKRPIDGVVLIDKIPGITTSSRDFGGDRM